MTFEEAYDELNQGDSDKVAKQMEEWHPAILGMMLQAVQRARDKRYLSPHPDYDNVLWRLAQKRGKVEGTGRFRA